MATEAVGEDMLAVDYCKSLLYEEVKLTDLKLDFTEAGNFALKLGETPLELSDLAFEYLCGYLAVPYKFAKYLTDKKPHALIYLQKQLAQSYGDAPVTMVRTEDKILSLTEKSYLPFTGKEALSLDTQIAEVVAKSDFELTQTDQNEGEVQYQFFLKADHVIKDDLEPLWKYGYTLNYSLLGTESPYFGVQTLRMVCANLTCMPTKAYNYPIPNSESFDSRFTSVANFIKEPPAPKWLEIAQGIKNMVKYDCSVRELQSARSKLHKVAMIDKDDLENRNRIDQEIQWPRVKEAYKLSELEVKPSRDWFSRASTPVNLFSLYNTVTREATHAPNSVDWYARQDLLVYSGNIMHSKPDLSQFPPIVNWSAH